MTSLFFKTLHVCYSIRHPAQSCMLALYCMNKVHVYSYIHTYDLGDVPLYWPRLYSVPLLNLSHHARPVLRTPIGQIPDMQLPSNTTYYEYGDSGYTHNYESKYALQHVYPHILPYSTQYPHTHLSQYEPPPSTSPRGRISHR